MHDVSAPCAVAFRVAAHGLVRRRSPRSLASAAMVAMPDYPRGAALFALAARCRDVRPSTLQDALAAGDLVRSFSLRGTAHVFAASVAAAYTISVLPTPGDESAAQASLGSSWPTFAELGVPANDALARVASDLGDVAADGRPRTKGDLSAALHGRLPPGWKPWCGRCRANHVPDMLFRLALIAAGLRFSDDGPSLILGPRPDPSAHAAARAELVRLFLSAYAPSPPRSFAEWAGVGAAEASASFAALGDELTQVRLDGVGPAFVLATDEPRLADPPDVAGVRLLAAGDPFLHQRDRATLVPDPKHRRDLWRPAGAPGLILHDGTPAGTWRAKHNKGTLRLALTPWATLPSSSALEPEALTVARASATPPPDVELSYRSTLPST